MILAYVLESLAFKRSGLLYQFSVKCDTLDDMDIYSEKLILTLNTEHLFMRGQDRERA